MRKAKRFLAFVLATMMVVTTCLVTTTVFAQNENSAVAFSDVSENAIYADAVKTFSLMGIIKGYEDGSFRPDRNVTRAEFTAMLMRTLNYGTLGSSSAAKLPFSDVDDNDSSINWAIPNINTAYDMGIINGYDDGTFRPSANVSYEEALKMIVCTLGYTGIDVSGTPWYAEYVNQAGKLGITENAYQLGAVETPASRACIAQMLYDSLEVEMVEQDKLTKKTILANYLGYIKSTGVISSDGVTSITAPDVNLRDDEVQIYGQEPDGTYATYTYKTTDLSLKNYLGHEIEYYYKNDGSVIRTLAIYVLRKNNAVTVTADMIDQGSTVATQIKYYKTENDKSASSINLDAENIVIYNGKLLGANAAASRFSVGLIPQVGSITLLDSDGDNKFDIIKIDDYEVYYVSSKVSPEYSIIDDVTKTGNDKKLILNVDDASAVTTIVDEDGNAMSYGSIVAGDVICLATSNAGNGGEVLRKAVVIRDTVTGAVTTVEDDFLTIGGNRYRVSPAAPWLNGLSHLLAEPALQDSGVYCKDINGNIVAYRKDAVVENIYYGYIMGMSSRQIAFDETKQLRILNQNGSEALVELQDDVKINGTSYSVADAVTQLTASAAIQNKDANTGYTVNQMIKYTTKNSGGKVVLNKVYTAEQSASGNSITSDKLYFLSSVTGANSMTYNSSARKLTGENGTVVDIGNAIVFVVPSNRSDYDRYRINSLSATFKNNGQYYVEVFDVSQTNSAKVVVCYGGNASSDVDDSSPVNVISENIVSMTNPDADAAMKYLVGFSSADSSAGQEIEGWVSTSSTWEPDLGDIYRAGTDRDGYSLIKSENVIYSVGGSNTFGIRKSGTDFYDSEYAVLLGSVYRKADDSISILPERIIAGQTVTSDAGAMTFSFDDISDARVIYYNESGSQLAIHDVTSDCEGILKSLVPYEDGLTNPSKVMLYMSEGKIKMFCILDKNA